MYLSRECNLEELQQLASSCSFGYADFSCEEDAKAAVELNGSEIDGRNIRIDFANSTPKRQGSSRGTPRGRDRGGMFILP